MGIVQTAVAFTGMMSPIKVSNAQFTSLLTDFYPRWSNDGIEGVTPS
jgi:hypothetical protein